MVAVKQAQIRPDLREKRQLTLDFLEASVMQGSEVDITPVIHSNITDLSGEEFTYLPSINTYITFSERPSVKLLRQYGWFREDAEIQPIVAFMPTHLLYKKREDGNALEPTDVVNFLKLEGDEYQDLVNTGESQNYVLKPLRILRGTIVDIHYDFLPDNTNKFYVTDVKVDTVSINYVANLMPYKYDKALEGDQDYNTPQLSVNTRDNKF